MKFIYNCSFNFKSSYISVKFKEYEYSLDVQVLRPFFFFTSLDKEKGLKFLIDNKRRQ